MTDEGKKKLTEFIGECWHEKGEKIGEGGVYDCKKCKRAFHRQSGFRTFTTWQDTGDLKDKLAEKGEWGRFEQRVRYIWIEITYTKLDFILWLFDRERFPELVLAYLDGLRQRVTMQVSNLPYS